MTTWPIPVRIRGIDYPSIQKAADALGVHRTTIERALERGTQDSVGMRLNTLASTVEYEGVVYPSLRQAVLATRRSEHFLRTCARITPNPRRKT